MNWNNYNLLNENLQKARSILKSKNIPETNEDFKKLRELLSKNPGYLGKFTEWMFTKRKSVKYLEEVLDKLKSQKISKSIDDFETPEDLVDYLIRDKADIAVNQIVHSIPSDARKALMHLDCDCDGYGFNDCRYCDRGCIKCKKCKPDDNCDECGGDGDINCPKCDGEGGIECDECDGNGNIKCDCKNGVNECDKCDGDGCIECDKCDGDGCNECDGEGFIECNRCDGEGSIECRECDGNGSKQCKKCDYGSIDCRECDGKGQVGCECIKVNGPCDCDNGVFKCTHCKNGVIPCKKDGTKQWKDLLNFFKVNYDKKDIICDFFSKKGGRYSDADDSSVYGDIKRSIENLLEMGDVESISKKAKVVKDVKVIVENDDILLIATNWEGLQKFGSSFWCITEDEETYDDYLRSEDYDGYDDDDDEEDHDDTSKLKQQWIIYFKGKIPFADNKSVLGITVDIEYNLMPSISAAHWEDDSSANFSEVQRILRKVLNNSSNKNIVAAFIDVYNHNKSFIDNKFYISIEDDFNEIIKDKKSIDLKSLIEKLDASRNRRSKILCKLLKDSKIKYYVNGSDDTTLSWCFEHDIYEDLEIKKLNLSALYYVISEDSFDPKKCDFFIKKLGKKDFLKFISEIDSKVIYILTKLNKLDEVVLEFGDLINDMPDYDFYKLLAGLSEKAIKKYFSNISISDFQKRFARSHNYELKVLINLINNKNLLDVKSVKDFLIKIIHSTTDSSIKNYILDNIDDDDIENACHYSLLHPKLKSKYDFTLKRREDFIKDSGNSKKLNKSNKVVEKLISWNDFIIRY